MNICIIINTAFHAVCSLSDSVLVSVCSGIHTNCKGLKAGLLAELGVNSAAGGWRPSTFPSLQGKALCGGGCQSEAPC